MTRRVTARLAAGLAGVALLLAGCTGEVPQPEPDPEPAPAEDDRPSDSGEPQIPADVEPDTEPEAELAQAEQDLEQFRITPPTQSEFEIRR